MDQPQLSPLEDEPVPLPPRHPNARVRTRAIQAFLCYLAFNFVVPLVALPPSVSLRTVFLAQIAVTAVFMFLQLWLALSFVRLQPRPAIAVLTIAGSVLLWFLLYVIHPHRSWPLLLAWLYVRLYYPLVGLAITLGCTYVGILLSRIIREPNVLLPVALVAMPIDYIGAMTPIGYTHDAVKHHPGFVQAVSVPVPAVGGMHAGIHAVAFVGPGDALFMAFFLMVVLRLHLNERGTFFWMYGLLTAAMLLVLLSGMPIVFADRMFILRIPDIAALVPMGLAVMIANARYFRFQRSEVFATIYAVLIVIALAVAFFVYTHHHLYHRA